MTTKLRKASWVMLTFEAVVLLGFSLLSAGIAYGGTSFLVGATPVEEVAGGAVELEASLRAVRGTAAAFSAAFAVLMLGTAIGPYRGGSKASWWTLLAGLAVLAALTALRIPTLGVRGGAGTAAVLFGFGLIALLLDVGRLRSGQ